MGHMSEQLENSMSISPDLACTFMLYAGSADDGSVNGRICRFCPESAAPFSGLDQAILLMSGWMDENGCSSGTASMRMFDRRRRSHSHISAADAAGSHRCGADHAEIRSQKYLGQGRRGEARKKEAFLVRVICRQHTSWQGEICWRNQEIYFRSCLELIYLIHSVINGARAERGEAALPETGTERKGTAAAMS